MSEAFKYESPEKITSLDTANEIALALRETLERGDKISAEQGYELKHTILFLEGINNGAVIVEGIDIENDQLRLRRTLGLLKGIKHEFDEEYKEAVDQHIDSLRKFG
jgi:hypothetical protein